jgi:hypothetical protein
VIATPSKAEGGTAVNDPEQMVRAGNYVLGLMNARERERAEHDLEVDPGFRDAVVSVAERMHLIDTGPTAGGAGGPDWDAVARRLGDLPHMRKVEPLDPAAARAPAARDDAAPQARAKRAAATPVDRTRAKAAAPLLYAALAGAAVAAAAIGAILLGL